MLPVAHARALVVDVSALELWGRVAGQLVVLATNDAFLFGSSETRQRYVYAWGNNERRAELKGRVCVIEARGCMSTVLVRFVDNDERVTTSFRALRAL